MNVESISACESEEYVKLKSEIMTGWVKYFLKDPTEK